MANPTEQQWLEEARALLMRGDFRRAEPLLNRAIADHPGSFELRRVLAGAYRQAGRNDEAEALLRQLLLERPLDAGSAFELARLLIEQARTRAAGEVLRTCFEGGQHDAGLAIRAIELLDDADRKEDAAAIAERSIALAPGDPRLHAYAGMLQLQLGMFDPAREHYLFALSHSPQACEWHVPLALSNAQRYADAGHPDFARFRDQLHRTDLSGKARSSLLFALGKAHDDIADCAQAAAYFREANAIAHSLAGWSRKGWRRAVEARLASEPPVQYGASPGPVPVFIVGMPRSGTTLLARQLSRYPGVCNRGELPWIAKLAERQDLNGNASAEALARAASFYMLHARRDEAPEVGWILDKQPLNFRYVDLILALFPAARIIHCARSARDTALSLWMQSFNEEVQGYAYDFDDIAVVMHDCARLMARWQRLYPQSIRTIRYEELVTEPDATLDGLARWFGLPAPAAAAGEPSSISTSSLWQARQPMYSHSLQRWRGYAEHVPELLQFPEG